MQKMSVILLEKMSHLGKIHHLKAQSVGAFGNEAEQTSFMYMPNHQKFSEHMLKMSRFIKSIGYSCHSNFLQSNDFSHESIMQVVRVTFFVIKGNSGSNGSSPPALAVVHSLLVATCKTHSSSISRIGGSRSCCTPIRKWRHSTFNFGCAVLVNDMNDARVSESRRVLPGAGFASELASSIRANATHTRDRAIV